MVVSPYLGVLIVQGDFNFALGVLGFAAVTDLVSVLLKLEQFDVLMQVIVVGWLDCKNLGKSVIQNG